MNKLMIEKMVLVAVMAAGATATGAGKQLMNLPPCAKSEKRVAVQPELTWPEKPGEAEVCLWKDDKIAALSITIDDNCKPDHEWWLKLSEELGFKLTWFVITDRVDRKENSGFVGTWEDWQKLADAGHSIQSHTTNHQSEKTMKRPLTDEELEAMYRDSLATIAAHVKGNRACCIAYPRGEAHREIVAKHVIAARGTSGVPDTADRIDYLCTNSGGSVATAEMLVDGRTEKGPKWLGSKTYLKRGWAVVLYHLVHHGKTAEEQQASAAKVEADVREMASHQDRLWIGRFEDVARYGQERDTAKLNVKVEGAKIRVAVTDDMKDDLFDFPLTVKIRLPDGWKTVKGGRFVEHDGKPFALVDVVPDRGEVVVARSDK